MTFFKSLWTDLVEKRLWPVALGLLLALVAVPVALGGGGSDPVEAPLGATGATGAGQLAQVALDPGAPVRRDRLGRVRDPFKQRAVKVATGATGATGGGGSSIPVPGTGATGGAGSTGGGSDDGGAGGGGTESGPQDPKPETKRPAPKPSYTTTVRLARVTAKERKAKEVEELTPLPSTDAPFLVYLGVLSGGKKAVFLLSSDVASEGDGTCKPRRSSCETIELEAGGSEVLSVTGEDEEVRRYQLDVVRVERTGTAKAAPVTTVKKKARAEDDLGTDRYSVDGDSGLLKRVKATSGLGAHLPGDEDAAAFFPWLATDEALEPMPAFVSG